MLTYLVQQYFFRLQSNVAAHLFALYADGTLQQEAIIQMKICAVYNLIL